MKIEHCPLWESGCSAPVCVLDKYWREMEHHPGEDACPFLVEAAKGENGVPPSGKHSEAVMAAAEAVWQQKELLPYPLLKKLNRASKYGSKRSNPNLTTSAD